MFKKLFLSLVFEVPSGKVTFKDCRVNLADKIGAVNVFFSGYNLLPTPLLMTHIFQYKWMSGIGTQSVAAANRCATNLATHSFGSY